MSAELPSLVARLEAVATRLESVASGGAGEADVGAIVQAFDEFMSEHVAQFVKLSNQIGGDVKTQADMVHNAFKAQRNFIATASKHQQPSQDVLTKLLKPTSDEIAAVQSFREKNRSSKLFNHLSALSEAVPALGWVTVKLPGPFVKDMAEAASFYLNRVLKDHKGDQTHTQWVNSIKAFLAELQVYTKKHHTTGVTWNKSGSPATAGGAAPPPPAGPAPPPPPPVQAPTDAAPGGGKGTAASALLSEISKAGTGISSGLRKVTDDQKTHKNLNLRKTGPVPGKPGQKQAAAPAAAKPVAKKNPVFELQGGKKWIVEYQENKRDLFIPKAEMSQTIYVYQCKNVTLHVKGKCNSIFVDGCKKTAIVFDDAIATCEFVNCQSVQCQVNGKVPTVSVDKTDGCQIFLSKDSIKSEIISSKSSEMNIMIPKIDGEYGEYAIPEQFKTIWNGSALVTDCTSSI